MLSYDEANFFFAEYRAVLNQFVEETQQRIDLIRDTDPRFNPARRPFITKIVDGLAKLAYEFNQARIEIFHGSDFSDSSYDPNIRAPHFTTRLERSYHDERQGKPHELTLEGYYFPGVPPPKLHLQMNEDDTGVTAHSMYYLPEEKKLQNAAELRPLLDAWFESFGGPYRPTIQPASPPSASTKNAFPA